MSDDTRHTPGPWVADGLSVIASDARATIVATVTGAASNPTAVADARLVAAAPDLLAALADLMQHCADQGWWLKSHAVNVMNAAKTALAKAEGGPR